MRSLVIVLLVVAVVNAFYEGDSKVVTLTTDNFSSLVLDSDDLWLIEFYAPWCGHCKKLTPEFDKSAKALDGIVKLGAVDMTTQGDAGKDYDVSSYPTIKFFGKDKNRPINFEGERKKAGIIDYCLDRARELALSRLGLKVANPSTGDDQDVVVLTDSNFDGLVFNSELPWFVEFYAPWCKHCIPSKKLAPEWAKLATKLKGEINIAKVDATTETELAQRFKVEGFPSLKYFASKVHDDTKAEEFGGDREYQELLNFAKKKLGTQKSQQKAAASISLEQLADQAVFNQKCSNGKTCVISFLPSLPQSSPEERQGFIQTIKDTAVASKQSSYFYLWATGGDFEEFEAEVNVLGSGYPATVAVNSKQSKFYNYRGGFNVESLTQFVVGVAEHRENGVEYEEFPTLKVTSRKDDL